MTTPKYIRKKGSQLKEIWLFSEALWNRGDFDAVPLEEAEALLGIRDTPSPVADKPVPEVPVAEEVAELKPSADEPLVETLALFTWKRAAFGHYNILDRLGNVVVKHIKKADAEAKIAELSA